MGSKATGYGADMIMEARKCVAHGWSNKCISQLGMQLPPIRTFGL